RVRNPSYAELGIEPMEMRIRRELGTVLPLDRVTDAPRHVAELLRGAAELRKRNAALREEWVFNFGRSVEVGAREIARIADGRASCSRSAFSWVAPAWPSCCSTAWSSPRTAIT